MADPVTRDLLATFEDVRSRLFTRLEGLTDAEYRWQPVPESMTIRPTGEGVFRADSRLPDALPGAPEPVTTIAWRTWHIGSFCLRGVLALAEDWARFIAHVEGLGDQRLLAPMERGGEFGNETYLKLALHALDEVAHHGGEIGLLRDLYLRHEGV